MRFQLFNRVKRPCKICMLNKSMDGGMTGFTHPDPLLEFFGRISLFDPPAFVNQLGDHVVKSQRKVAITQNTMIGARVANGHFTPQKDTLFKRENTAVHSIQ